MTLNKLFACEGRAQTSWLQERCVEEEQGNAMLTQLQLVTGKQSEDSRLFGRPLRSKTAGRVELLTDCHNSPN